MNYKCVDLKYGKLHLIQTKKFRSINIKILLKDKIKKEDITKRNFLTDYLVLTTKKYKTRKELALKIQELYSLYISSYNTRIGNYLVTRFNMSLLNPKYTEDGMLSESIDLLHEIIFNPNQKNNKFDSNLFKIIKKDILTEIETVKENPRMYSNIKMLENMGSDSYSYHGYGYKEDLEMITEENLYKYYKEFLTKSDVDIYVIGDFKEDEVIKLVKEKLDFKTLKKEKENIYITHKKINKRSKTIVENSNFNQSKLAIGCKIGELSEFERKYVINLYNMILGGGFNSKFMQEIREKKSLAYYINSAVNKADNILIIQSGISYQNFDKVISSIKKIMKNISLGSVTEEELENVKVEYLSILEETYDSEESIVENYIALNLLDLDNYETRKKRVLEVSLDDIKNISKKVSIDTVYLLKGDNNGKN
ncbi:MAG: insulinase family protein [Bacilli bacterium]|nr:insulinase family protein [Bacilli bacterium]